MARPTLNLPQLLGLGVDCRAPYSAIAIFFCNTLSEVATLLEEDNLKCSYVTPSFYFWDVTCWTWLLK